MADFKIVQIRRGTTLQHETFVGSPGELTVDTDKWTVVVHDGVTEGGFPLKVEAIQYSHQRYLTFRAAAVQQGFASLGFSAPANNAPQALAVTETSGIITGVAVFNPTKNQTIQDHFRLPLTWTAPLTLDVFWRTEAVIGEAIWSLQLAIVPTGSTIEDASFGPPQSITTIANSGPLTIYDTTIPIDTTGFPSTGEIFFQLSRDGGDDTITADIQMLSLVFTINVLEK